MKFSEYLTELRNQVREDRVRKIKRANKLDFSYTILVETDIIKKKILEEKEYEEIYKTVSNSDVLFISKHTDYAGISKCGSETEPEKYHT